MKKGIILTALIALAQPVFAGESVQLIEQLESHIRNYTLEDGVSHLAVKDCTDILDTVGTFIKKSEPKLNTKFSELRQASLALLNVIGNIHVNYMRKSSDSSRNAAQVIQNMEKNIQPLKDHLKKIKGSFLSGVSLFKKSESKKSEAEKVFDATKNILIDRMQNIIKEFEDFKKQYKQQPNNISTGESIGLIENLKGNTKKYSFRQEVSAQDFERWNRAMQSAGTFIREYEPKVYAKFEDLQKINNVLFNVIKIIHNKYIKKIPENDPFYTPDKKMISMIEVEMAPLYNELKKLKSPAFSGASLIKSEAQKVLNEIKVILIQRMQEIIDDFDQFKKLSTDTKSVSKEAQEFREGFWN